jgi:hypothetical protein
VFVSAAFGIQHVMGHIDIGGSSGFTIFFHIKKGMIFEKGT